MAPRGGVRFAVRLTPRGGADRVDGVRDGVLRVRVAAAPVDGAANAALLRLLAEGLGVSRAAVTIAAGASSRTKLVAVEGVEEGDVLRRWPGLRL